MMSNEMISSSLEDYLEAIFQIVAEKQAVRAKDIAKRLKVKSSSVTGALHSLAEKGLINYAPYDVITLTSAGKKTAKGIVNRHNILRDFFVNILLIDEAEAQECACKMEHLFPPQIFERMTQFLNFMKDFIPMGQENWKKEFKKFCETGTLKKNHEGNIDKP